MKVIYYFTHTTVKPGERFKKSDSPRGSRGFDTFDECASVTSVKIPESLSADAINLQHGWEFAVYVPVEIPKEMEGEIEMFPFQSSKIGPLPRGKYQSDAHPESDPRAEAVAKERSESYDVRSSFLEERAAVHTIGNEFWVTFPSGKKVCLRSDQVDKLIEFPEKWMWVEMGMAHMIC